MKKYLYLFLLSLLPMVASAYDAEINGIYYNLNSTDKTASVTYKELNGWGDPTSDCSGDIVIPSEVTYNDATYKVTAIENQAFYKCKSLTSVTIHHGLITIGEEAFFSCKELTSVTIPNSVMTIGKHTFAYCEKLASVPLPNGLKTIESGTFSGCKALDDVNIPNSVTTIGYGAFQSSGLVSVFIPKGVTTIGSKAFCQTKLNTVFIPNSVTTIGVEAFCQTDMISVIIPNSVETIEKDAFLNCVNLNFLSLGSGIQTIGGRAFRGIPLSTVHYLATSPVALDDNVFKDDVSSISLYFPKGCHSKYSVIDPWRKFNDWTIDTSYGRTPHTLTVELDGETYDTFELLYDATIGLLPAPYKEGHTFDGWINSLPSMPDEDYTIRGTFTPNTYKLTYKIDGEADHIEDVTYGTPLTQASPYEAPAKEGYEFSGWTGLPETMPAHDVEVTGKYSICSYKLTYMLDGEVYKTYELEYGSYITPLGDPDEKEGYTFSGWSEIPETMPAHDVEVTGTFTVNKYKLIYQVDNEDYQTFELDYGTAITPLEKPTKEGYTFSGWSEIPETMPAHDTYVNGYFTINTYKLQFYVDEELIGEVEVEYGASITTEMCPEPTKEGYTFAGWSETPETMPAHDVKVTGTFTVNKYKLIYQVDDEDYQTVELEYGATITPLEEPTKEGYTFSGWSDTPETMPACDMEVKGYFTINIYKLQFYVDEELIGETDVQYGASITTEMCPEPMKEGYTFSGWEGLPETMPAKDVEVKATFTVNKYKLIYQVDDEDYQTFELEYGATITPLDDLTKEGYTFSGWSEIPETMPAYDIYAYGYFTINTYKLKFYVDGEVYEEREVEYGADLTALCPEYAPTKEGYEFSGWEGLPETMPAHDVEVTATFTPVKQVLEGDANGDGTVNVADIDYVIERIGEAKDDFNKSADVNGDDAINVADVDYIIERIK